MIVAAFWVANASGYGLWLAFVFSVMGALVLGRKYFFSALKRVKWLVVLMFVVYAYTTPGEYVHAWLFETRPTYEGIRLAGLQACKLWTMLALLALLIGSVSRQALLSGLCQLVQPLRQFKIDGRPFALRLWLTLYYVESYQTLINTKQSFVVMFERVATIEHDFDHDIKHVTFDVVPLQLFDRIQLVLLWLLFIWMWVK